MADVAKRPRNSRKALKEKNPEVTESPAAAAISKPSDPATAESVASQAKKAKATKKKAATPATDFEKALEEMQAKLKELTIEKEKADVMLREKDEILREREEEIENRGREQEKLQVELKKLQKLKEFKPTLILPVSQSLKEKEQDKKEKKKKGCPEKKKPSPPYILWCKDQWNEVKKENPEAEFKDISNILGTKWKSVTAEEKKPYEEKFLADKEAYLQVVAKEKRETEAMKLFDDEHKQKTAMELLDQYLRFKEEAESEEMMKKKKSKKEKDPLKPKQPISAFFLFTNERRPVLAAEGKSFLEVAKITGEEWKNMTEKQKAPFEEVAKKNKEKYSQEMEIYNQRKEEESASLKKEEEELMKLHKQEAMQMLKKKEKTDNIIKKTKEENRQKKKKIVDPNKPKKPASSYLLFCKEARKAILETVPAGTKNDTISAMISVRWKELSEEERKVWNEKAGEAMEVYKKELEEYNKTVTATADSEE